MQCLAILFAFVLVFVDRTIVLKLASAFVSITDALNEGHNMQRSGSGRIHNSLKQKIQKNCEEINLMKEENEYVEAEVVGVGVDDE